MFSSIRWRIALPYVLLILLSMGALTGYLSTLVRDTYLDNLRDQLLSEAQLLADALGPALTGDHLSDGLDAQAKRYAEILETRVTIIGMDGVVLGESNEAMRVAPKWTTTLIALRCWRLAHKDTDAVQDTAPPLVMR